MPTIGIRRITKAALAIGIGISRKIDAPKSSTHTILLTLERSGFVRRDDRTGHYSLGLKIFDLASSGKGDTEIREQAHPELVTLEHQTGLTAHLAVLDREQVVYVDKVESNGLVKMNTWVGRRIDAHCTAIGKALLAYLAPAQFDELFRSKPLTRRTPRTIASKEALKRELQKISTRGFAIDDEECGAGVRCVAASIFDRGGKAVATALGVVPISSFSVFSQRSNASRAAARSPSR